MIAVKNIASVVYGCIVGNWINTVLKTIAHRPGGEHRYVVLAQASVGYIRIIETDSETVALDFEGRIDEETETITAFIFDRLYPADKEELENMEILDSIPPDVEEREKLLAYMHEARKYW